MDRVEGGRDGEQGLLSGLIRIYVPYHACQEHIFGLGMIEELQRRGCKLSPGTLYPLLHGLERMGYLCSSGVRSGKAVRRLYRATPSGRETLAKAREKMKDILGELIV